MTEAEQTSQPLGLASTDGLGPSVPKAAIQALCEYGNARADQDQESAARLSDAIVLLRQWAATLQAAERERCARLCEEEALRVWGGPSWAQKRVAVARCAELIRGA